MIWNYKKRKPPTDYIGLKETVYSVSIPHDTQSSCININISEPGPHIFNIPLFYFHGERILIMRIYI